MALAVHRYRRSSVGRAPRALKIARSVTGLRLAFPSNCRRNHVKSLGIIDRMARLFYDVFGEERGQQGFFFACGAYEYESQFYVCRLFVCAHAWYISSSAQGRRFLSPHLSPFPPFLPLRSLPFSGFSFLLEPCCLWYWGLSVSIPRFIHQVAPVSTFLSYTFSLLLPLALVRSLYPFP